MKNRFKDPDFVPPADLSEADARAYEEAVLGSIREALPLGPHAPHMIIESIDLEGHRPDTAIVFKYRDPGEPERLLAQRAPIWNDIVHNVGGRRVLDDAFSVGGWIFSAFTADELEPYEVS